MHTRLRKLWLGWSTVILVMLLILTFGVSQLAQQAARQLDAPELEKATQIIGRSLARDLERAIGYQIPVDGLVGINDWFASIITSNDVITALSLTDKNGRQLAAQGVSEPLRAALEQRRSKDSFHLDNIFLTTMPVRGTDGQPIAWLHIACTPEPVSYSGWLWMLGAALLLSLLASQLLRWLIIRRLQQPLIIVNTAAHTLSTGHLPQLRAVVTRDPATALQATMSDLLYRLRKRHDFVLLKITEVRAAHFDANIVASLDALAVPLQTRCQEAQISLSEDTTSRPKTASATRRALLSTITAMLILLTCGWLVHREYQAANDRRLLEASSQILQEAWKTTLDRDKWELDEELRKFLAQPGIDQQLTNIDHEVIEQKNDDDLILAVWPLAEKISVDSTRKNSDIWFDPLILESMRQKHADTDTDNEIHGIWQNAERLYQSGVARPIDNKVHKHLIQIAARPLEASLLQTQKKLSALLAASSSDPLAVTNVKVSLADLRGQAVFESDAELVRRWTAQGRNNSLLQYDGKNSVMVGLPLTAPSGQALGTLIAQWSTPPLATITDSIVIISAMTLAIVTLLILLIYLRNLSAPLGQATHNLERLAAGDTDIAHLNTDLASTGETRLLAGVVRRLAEKIDALETLKRSRERQGKRQARFIRMQMMQLAGKLEEGARRGILEDLDRIEHASRPAPESNNTDDPRVERIVDEFGILALGFQNLVSRVGQQYQELDRLVAELREALRTKTQFIALQQELEIARKMQLSILPKQFTSNPALELHAMMLPAKEVGGDFYDFFSIDEHKVALVIADVSGKGVPAAFFMAISRTLLRAIAPFAESPAACISRVNDLLTADNEEMMFVTMFYAILDTSNGLLTYVNGGHNLPYVLHADGQITTLENTKGIALAVADSMTYQQGQITLHPGDGLFLFTDGITEAAAPDESLYGDERLSQALTTLRTLPVNEIPERMVALIKDFESGAPQADDITCLMARFKGSSGAEN